MTQGTKGARLRLPVREEPDVAVARLVVRELAAQEEFPPHRAAALATAVSEVARNIVVHASAGEIELAVVEDRGRRGIRVVARDGSPGIPDLAAAMRDGYSTSSGLGLGLPSARRLVDEFTIVSSVEEGTTVTMTEWAHVTP
jgi:serine/threonine-protein kinase RsbT